MTNSCEEDDEEFGDHGARFLLLLEEILKERLTCVGPCYYRGHLPVVPRRHIDCVSVEQVDEK